MSEILIQPVSNERIPQIRRLFSLGVIAGAGILASCSTQDLNGPTFHEAAVQGLEEELPEPVVSSSLPPSTSADVNTTSIAPVASTNVASTETLAPPKTTTTLPEKTGPSNEELLSVESYVPFENYKVGDKLGRMFTSDGHIETDVYLTDSWSNPQLPFDEDPELDYVKNGAGVSFDNGLPALGSNSILLAHNTKTDQDYFRHLSEVEPGTILTFEYVSNVKDKEGDAAPTQYKDTLLFEAVAQPKFVHFVEGASYLYSEQKVEDAKTITLATCGTVNGDSNLRATVVFRFIGVSGVNEPVEADKLSVLVDLRAN